MCNNVFRIIIIATVAISADFKLIVNKNYIYEKEYFGVCANGSPIYKKCDSGRCPYAHQCEYNYCCPILTLQSSTSRPKLTSSTAKLSTTSSDFAQTATDCYDWRYINGATSNGIYRINPGYGLEAFDVYCDMTTDGGGWTVIQRRVDNSLAFYNNTWQQYKVGFNNGLDRNLWLGNDRIHVMSSRWNVTLRIELYGNRYPYEDLPNLYLYGKYNFSISDEMNNYKLQISLPIEGNASDANLSAGFMHSNGWPFSTVDKGSNGHDSQCSKGNQQGGWWYHGGCTQVTLNGKYDGSLAWFGLKWVTQATSWVRPIRSEMKIRRQ